MGSVIAALYAGGYSVEEIESFVTSEDFARMSDGELPDDYRYFFRSADPSAAMATIKYSKGTFITGAIPTNLIDPAPLDWNLMANFGAIDQAANYSFDSLYIPFRCIAADVQNKREIVFRNGSLNVALRASSTYPFYLPPRRVGGVLLYDGGIYNNFPVDMLYTEFMPDVIIGCTVSSENPTPKEGDILSQLESMIMFRDITPTLCDEMIVIKPKGESIGTFEFEKVKEAIELGYRATSDTMATILNMVQRKLTKEERTNKRAAFKSKVKPVKIEEIFLNGLENSQKYYIRKLINKKNPLMSLDELRKPYFRLFSDVRIKSIFPELKYNNSTGNFKLNLDVEKEKDLFISFGGNFSSRSINTGFVGLKYNLFGKTGATLSANSYFGRFYASVKGDLKWDFPGSYPISLNGSFTQNRWDYYKSLATFFDDVKPSFILLNERVGTLGISLPSGNNAKFNASASYAYMFDEYYQTQQFLSVDTADRTDLESFVFRTTWERSTLNRPQWASSGSYFLISGKYLNGMESTIPGTTSAIRDTTNRFHEWWIARVQYTNYFLSEKKLHAGFHFEGVASTMDFLNNYISSTIMAPAFQPIPESRTFFLPQFRAYNYVAGGLSLIYNISRAVDFRAEAYSFAAFGRIAADELNRASYRTGIEPVYMLSSSLVLHSPLGPISISANYYDQKEDPISILFNFGYIIFNSSPRD